MPDQHHRLSASGSKVWLACTVALKMAEGLPDETSAFAAEGTTCHELGELSLRERLLKEKVVYPAGKFSAEMFEAVSTYRDNIEALIAEFGPDPVVFVEQRVEFGGLIGVPGAFGTSDCILLWPDTGVVATVDLKYGKGVRVEAKGNSQGMLYALGVMDLVQAFCDIERVIIVIDQPRLEHLSRWEISAKDLLAWAEQITPLAQAAFAGTGTLNPGDHCDSGFCRARHTCPARAAEAMAAFEENDSIPGVMTPDQIAALLPKLPRIKAWAEGLLAFARDEAQRGQQYPGWKLVAGRSVRKWSDEEQVAKVLEAEGVDPWNRKLIGITDAEKAVGKKHRVFELTVKAEGAPVLVPESDKRAEFNGNIEANFD